jgi:diguanylate cyclase (GGDEF)-like protein
VPIDQLALLFALVIAANLVLFIALRLPRPGRRSARGQSAADAYGTTGWAGSHGGAGQGDDAGGNPGSNRLLTNPGGLPSGLYQRMTRVVSFIFIGSALVLAVLTDAPQQTAVIVLLAFGLIMIELFQDVLPASALGRLRLPIEATTVLVFLTLLIAMTGGLSSPYFFGYILLVGAAALSTSETGGVVLAVISSAAYLTAVLIAADGVPLPPADMGLVAFNLISIALVMYVGSVIGREQRRAHEEALRLSRFDSLTGLFSRVYFMSELEQEILRATRTGRPFAVAMIDLDGLKAANDRFGHDWGDNLLKAVADVMRGDIRVTDVAARYGGDEFVLMLPETDISGAILVAEKVRVDISRVALPHNGQVVRTSASIGIVTFPQDGRTSAELMRRADLAMYEAKRRGRDQIVRFAREGVQPASIGGPRVQVHSTSSLSPTQPPTPVAAPFPLAPPAATPTPVAAPVAAPSPVQPQSAFEVPPNQPTPLFEAAPDMPPVAVMAPPASKEIPAPAAALPPSEIAASPAALPSPAPAIPAATAIPEAPAAPPPSPAPAIPAATAIPEAPAAPQATPAPAVPAATAIPEAPAAPQATPAPAVPAATAIPEAPAAPQATPAPAVPAATAVLEAPAAATRPVVIQVVSEIPVATPGPAPWEMP